MSYDLNLGGIDLPTFEQDFSETLGSDYTLVGSAVMPGPPRPASMYNLTINIYGDTEEPDRTTAGFTKRGQVKALLQNAAARYAGLAFTCVFDSSLNGYVVIGTGDISYNTGGATFGDFQLRCSNVVWIPAPLTIQAMVTRPTVSADPVEALHYLPVGASNVVGQADPVYPKTTAYDTLDGKGVFVEGRPVYETLQYDQPWENVLSGSVRVWDAPTYPDFTKDGDLDPEHVYGWMQAFGPTWSFRGLPVIENGRTRARWDRGQILVETLKNGRYQDHGAVSTGYEIVGSPTILEWTSQEGTVRFPARSKDGNGGDVYVRLARGWKGPQVDVAHHAELRTTGVEGIAHLAERQGSRDRFLLGTTTRNQGAGKQRVRRTGG